MKKIGLVLVLALVSGLASAQKANLGNSTKPQQDGEQPVDGYFQKSNILNAKVSPYANVREAD
ncbi:MAG TPA: gliding motility protein GldN, partial [Sphingobacteriaceae bacterium]